MDLNLTNYSLTAATPTVLPLDDLLDTLGFNVGKTVTDSIVLPILNFLGLILCSLSAWIFFCGRFTDPVFVYYRLMSIVNILSLLHNIPEGILLSPRYFPSMDTYAAAIYHIYLAGMSVFLFHFSETLQIGILLQRMKSFNSFVKRHFTAEPKLVCFLFFLICFAINSMLAISFRPVSLGNYIYYDSNGNRREATLYFFKSSVFSSSSIGKIIMMITGFFLNLFPSLIVGIALNIVSFIQYKASLKRRQREVEDLAMSSIHNRATTIMELNQQRQKEKDKRQIKRNMYMVILLCTVSITSKLIIVLSAFYYFFYFSLSDFLLIELLNFSIFFFNPTVSFFIYYFFNNTFKKECNRIILLIMKTIIMFKNN